MKNFLTLFFTFSALLFFSFGYAETNLVRNSPPGLQSKGGEEFPRGLEKQEKVPTGWSKGEKRGLNKNHHHHYLKHKHIQEHHP